MIRAGLRPALMALVALLLVPVTASAADPVVTPLAAPVWLCKPGCRAILRSERGGRVRRHARYPVSQRWSRWTPRWSAARPHGAGARTAADCFYAYPTVDIVSTRAAGGQPAAGATDEEFAQSLAQVGMLARAAGCSCRPTPAHPRPAGHGGHHRHHPDYSTGVLDIKQAWADYWRTTTSTRPPAPGAGSS